MAKTIDISTKDGSFSAYVAAPGAPRAPAIVVIQEIFGVNAVMRAICEELAAEGYLAVCPDLFWRIEPRIDITDQSEAEWKRAFELYTAFDVDRGVEDIGATVRHVRGMAECSGRVGAVGFCLGGLLAFLTATRTDAQAAVAYYGVGIDKCLTEADRIVSPVLLHIAEEDQFVTKDAQAAIVSTLSKRPGIEIHPYPGRDHAFARRGGAHFDAADAALAWRRTLALFKRAL